MKREGLICRTRRYRMSQGAIENAHVDENLLKRKFTQKQPNQAWCSDCTYMKVGGVWMYICAIIDLFSRMGVGWEIGDARDGELAKKTFRKAFKHRGEPKGLIFHSDKGSEYTGMSFRMMLIKLGVIQSFAPTASPLDNSVCESFFSALKKEGVGHNVYLQASQLYNDAQKYIDFYNNERIHSANGMRSPQEVEDEYYNLVRDASVIDANTPSYDEPAL